MIVADSSPLIMMARNGLLVILRQTSGSVIIPQPVWDECVADRLRPGAFELIAAEQAKLLSVVALEWKPDPKSPLGEGEAAAIELAVRRRLPLLIDEKLGRIAAQMRGVQVIGSAGILIKAKQLGHLHAVKPVLISWKEQGYFLSDALIEKILALASE